jgi:hypothetical protein
VVKINSAEAAGIAAQFTLHNGKLLGSIRYELLKVDAVPVWRLTCAAQDGNPLGTIVLHATNGTVISFDGFASCPQAIAAAAPQDVPAATESVDSEVTSERPTRSTSTASKPKPTRRKQTVARRSSSPGPIDRVGSFFRKVFR